MSIQNNNFSNSSPAVERTFPVVLRFASMFPEALARYEMHAARRGGDLSHVNPEKKAQNRILIGPADWRRLLQEEIQRASYDNLTAELEAIRKRKRLKELEMRALQGAKQPWKASKDGPLREVILTAHRDWFAERTDMDVILNRSREQVFEQRAVDWLKLRFGASVVHARADHDETTYHIHAVLAPWTEKTTIRRGKQKLLQPSVNDYLRDYERAQDDVGDFFSAVGLTRGKRTKAAREAAKQVIEERIARRARIKAKGRPVRPSLAPTLDPVVPLRRKHVPPAVWRAEEAQRLEEDRKRLKAEVERVARADAEVTARKDRVEQREREAEDVIGLIEVIVEGKQPPATVPTSGLARRLLAALENISRKMRADAEKRAEEKIAEEVAATMSLRASVVALRERMVAVLPPQIRARFARETAAEEAQAKTAVERVETLRKRPPAKRE